MQRFRRNLNIILMGTKVKSEAKIHNLFYCATKSVSGAPGNGSFWQELQESPEGDKIGRFFRHLLSCII